MAAWEGSEGDSCRSDTLKALHNHVCPSLAFVEVQRYLQAVADGSLSASRLGEVPSLEL